MTSTISSKSHFQIVPNKIDTPCSTPIFRPNETDTPYSTPIFRPTSRRTVSFGSSSPSLSSNSSPRSLSFGDYSCESPLFSPGPPLESSGRIPFSWEQIPGIPKNQNFSNKNDSSSGVNNLPLPPSRSNSFRKTIREDQISPKKFSTESFREDPFFAALVECSKDDHDGLGKFFKNSKIPKNLSDRLAIISMYTSCKSSCGVSESAVSRPRPTRYRQLNRRSS